MTEYIDVNEEYVASVLANAKWDVAHVDLSEKRGGKKGDKPAKGKKGDKPDFTTGARKGDEDEKGTGKDFDKDEMKEEVAEHACPLCESALEEEISDEKLLEHLDLISEIFTALNEEELEESQDSEVDEATEVDEASEEESEEEEVDENSARAKLLTRVKAMRTSSDK